MSRKIDVYNIEELKEKFPDAYDKAYEEFKEGIYRDPCPLYQEEILDCMKATFSHAGLMLRDWEIGPYSPSYVKFGMGYEDRDFEGRKAYNYLKNRFDLKSYKRVAYKNHLGKTAYRYDFKKLDGTDWSCEFTGICYDHDYLESLFECIHDGMTLKDAFSNLADVAARLLENEHEYTLTEEYFLEEACANEYEYTEEGERV